METKEETDGTGARRETPESGSGAEKKGKTRFTALNVARAVSSTAIFGIPLLVGTVTMVGYGVYKALKSMKR